MSLWSGTCAQCDEMNTNCTCDGLGSREDVKKKLEKMTALINKVLSAMRASGETDEAIKLLRKKRDEILK